MDFNPLPDLAFQRPSINAEPLLRLNLEATTRLEMNRRDESVDHSKLISYDASAPPTCFLNIEIMCGAATNCDQAFTTEAWVVLKDQIGWCFAGWSLGDLAANRR
jgi:hypothetical protein